jgi:RHS repeat-associated protein
MVQGSTTYRLIMDQVGSVRVVVNTSTGAVAERIDYDEYGNVVVDSAPGTQPFRFAGGLRDRDTGLTRFGARDYDPMTGRWAGKDPRGFGGGAPNLYLYCGVDPVNFIDPFGLYDTANDGAPATQAGISTPSALAIARDGTLYIGEGEQRLRRVTPEES